MAGFLRLWTRSRSRPATTRPIDFSDEGILNNLTQANLRNVWASRRMVDGQDHLYLVHFQHTAAVGPPITVVVKKFGNVDGMVDSHVKSRWKVERIMLALLQHENIIKILHVIEREEAVMLVYEYAMNGSLHYWLHRREGNHRALSWPERMGIAIGVAQGLCHMHHGCSTPVAHHNITCNNILLDQDLNPKICSFGVGQLNAGLNQPLPIVDLHVGDFGYTAPDYALLGTLTEKVDTYSFGVVLLELVTGRVANGDDCMLAIWARNNCNQLMASKQELFKEVVDMAIPHQAWYMKEMSTVFKLGVACTVVEPEQRPSMLTVLKKLRRARGLLSGILT
uniref:Uncharacterized protein n=1 Tax=Avena sativa TaxID=4498 RepID=A0ACD5XF15_AVESA